jgi:hypothetical protein
MEEHGGEDGRFYHEQVKRKKEGYAQLLNYTPLSALLAFLRVLARTLNLTPAARLAFAGTGKAHLVHAAAHVGVGLASFE